MVANRGRYTVLFAVVAVCLCNGLFAEDSPADARKRSVPIEAPPTDEALLGALPRNTDGAIRFDFEMGFPQLGFDGERPAGGPELLQYDPDPFPRWLRLLLERSLAGKFDMPEPGELGASSGIQGAKRKPFYPKSAEAGIDMRNIVRDAPLFPSKSPQAESRVVLRPGEAAHEILQIRKSLGGGALLEGTVFQQPEYQSPGEDENIFVEAIRRSEYESRQDYSPRRVEIAPTAVRHREPLPIQGDAERVDVLRDVSAQLDQAANLLEEHNLYQRADELRDAAQQIRLDARRALSTASTQDIDGYAPSARIQPSRGDSPFIEATTYRRARTAPFRTIGSGGAAN